MALKLKLSAEEYKALEEGIRGLYEEKDGGYILSVDGIEDTSGLKSALEKERKSRSDYEKLARSYRDLGKSPEEISELLKVQEEAEKTTLEKRGEWDKLKTQLLETHKKELEAERDKVQKMNVALESYLIDAQATEAIASEKGIPLLLLPHIKNMVKAVEENGKYLVRVIGPDGVPRMNGKGEYLTIKDAVSEMKKSDIFARAFEGSGVTGGGSGPSIIQAQGGGYVISRQDAQDPMKYRAAKEAAQKAGHSLQIAPE